MSDEKDLVEKAKSLASDAKDSASDAVTSTVDATVEKVGDVAEAVGETGGLGNLVDKAKDIAGDAKDAAGNVLGKVSDLPEAAVGKASDAVEAVGDVGKAAVGATIGAVGGLAAGLTGGLGNLVDKTKDAAGDAKDAAGGVVGKVGDVVEGAADKVGDAGKAALGVAAGAAGAVVGGAGAAVDKVDELVQGAGLPKWVAPGVILLTVFGAGFFLMRGCNNETSVPSITDTQVRPAGATGGNPGGSPAPEASPAAETSPVPEASPEVALTDIKLPDGTVLKGAAEGIESKLVGFVLDATKPVDKTTWFNFDRLLFETSKATLNKSGSQAQLENVVAILKAFPNVSLKVGGYTDNTGNKAANMKLSADRATAVVTELVSMGVDKARLEPEGYGDQHPVADNATEEGRSQNRRIAVRVTKK